MPRWRRWANRFLECYYPAIPFYTRARFEIIERRITFRRLRRWLGVAWLANRFPEIGRFVSRGSSGRAASGFGCA